ncbi:TPM domain-containing protein [Sphingomonas azotifigens]|uniref:TPM domain-containing protein n=1 Tax=Sphingomonas azotifigens TaxID=330920 RepID=UPI00142FC765|nr:TPM domain-containing protein [Sphingomonas azotifigens]
MLLHGCGASAPAASTVVVPAPPVHSVPVADFAELLTAEQARALTRRLADARTRTHHEVAVVTVCSLYGETIDAFSWQLANLWGVGRRFYYDGIVLLVAPVERKARIEVGFGLETALTDAESAMILYRDILPRFRAGDWNGGINAGVTSILREIS